MRQAPVARIAVVGSRKFPNRNLAFQVMRELITNDDIIVSGGAKGPDTWAEEFAAQHGIKTEIWTADWEMEGKSAGFKRNKRIAINCDAVIAFRSHKSKGTRHTIQIAFELGRPITVVSASGKIKEFKPEFWETRRRYYEPNANCELHKERFLN